MPRSYALNNWPDSPECRPLSKRNAGRFPAGTVAAFLSEQWPDSCRNSGRIESEYALKLSPMLFARPGEIRKMLWADVDLEAAEWKYFVTKVKLNHLVPLSRQAVEILQNLKLLTNNSKYVFPSIRSPLVPMSENTINAALRRLGFTGDEIVAHGFRAMARTLLHETLGFSPDAIEAQLSHAVPDRLGRAYNRTQFIEERRRMMQYWADYLDSLKAGAKVLPLRRAA